jgi:hypothetical protein
MFTVQGIKAEIEKMLAERDAALRSLANVECHPRLRRALEDLTFQFYQPTIDQLEARLQVAEHWQSWRRPSR